MGKILVVAEKPSVGRDIAAALPGTFKASQDKTHLVGDDYVITWTVGHLVGLADPEEYDPKLKKWRFADLPIVPSKFKLVPNDAKAEKQLKAIHRLMRSDEIDVIINACDAGREGELIFAYTYETSKSKKPVKRLWLSSMTRKAIQEAFQRLRDGDEMKDLESAARARSEADWIVGMNATRAATIGCARHSTAPSRSAACRRRRWRWWCGASSRSARSSPSPTGSSRLASEPRRVTTRPLHGRQAAQGGR
jgi:Topoisomerase IA